MRAFGVEDRGVGGGGIAVGLRDGGMIGWRFRARGLSPMGVMTAAVAMVIEGVGDEVKR